MPTKLLSSFLVTSLILISSLIQGGVASGAPVSHRRSVPVRHRPRVHVVRVHRRDDALVSPLVMALTTNVNRCEESGDWHVAGPTYFGGIGWLWATWQQWRQPSDPLNMAQATPQEQARAMARFVGHVMGGWWPDQPAGHCTGAY